MFLKARLKLTFLYTAIVAVIVAGFSLFLYQTISYNLNDGNDSYFADTQSQQHYIHRALQSVQNDLLLSDLTIILLAAGASYVLAGRLMRPLQIILETQKAFAANASHELRTPLAVMKNDTEVLMRNAYPSKESIHKTLTSNLEEVDRMSKIVEDLLTLARSDTKASDLTLRLDLSSLVEHMVQKMKPLASGKGIHLIFASSGKLLLKGTPAALERAILNILQNSIHHTPPGGSITTTVAKKDASADITITDSGEGIGAEELPHVFTRFYKGKSKGTGLGLSIVKEIVEEHGGTVSIESAKGKGTSVHIRLPTL